MIEYDLMEENPEFIRNKLTELERETKNKKNLYLAKLKVAEENQQKKADRLGIADDVEVWDYRTTTPPTPPKASPKKGGDK